MIPKIIHYCWFGRGEMPKLVQRCMASWHQFMPDWTYMCWNEDNFDVASAPIYVQQAYEVRKYAFVSDYVRLWALEQYGGVYLDTDVEVIRSFDSLLNNQAFIGFEESKVHLPGTCVMGSIAKGEWIQTMLKVYDGISFIKPDGTFDFTTNVCRLGNAMKTLGLNPNGQEQLLIGLTSGQSIVHIYPFDYFSPLTSTRVLRVSKNTYGIHHFAGSWYEYTRKELIKRWICHHILGCNLTDKIVQAKRKVKGK